MRLMVRLSALLSRVWALVGQKGCRIVGLGFQILGSASYLSNLEKGPLNPKP